MKFVCRVTVLAAVLTGLLVPATVGPSALAAAGRAGGTELWLARYTPPGGGGGTAVAASPDGSMVYVTGITTVAYDAATGKLRWASAVGAGQTVATGVAVSPDGARVFVTGTESYPNGTSQFVTTAYNAATGARLWQTNYGPVTDSSNASAVGVSPDGSTVFVTGASELVSGNRSSYRWATVAYDAATGARRWTARCCRGGQAEAASLAVSPDGAQVYVTGFSVSPAGLVTYATVAYGTGTGAVVWDRRYDDGGDDATARSVVVSPDGSRVYVTGETVGGPYGIRDTTVAYTAAAGTRLWAAHYGPIVEPGGGSAGMAISKNGTELVITGTDGTASGQRGYLTVAYRSGDGHQLWAGVYQGPNGNGIATSVALSPDAAKVFVTGLVAAGTTEAPRTSFGTVAYRAATGAQLWSSVYSGPLKQGIDEAAQVAVSPDGSRVFVTGRSPAANGTINYATLAYQP